MISVLKNTFNGIDTKEYDIYYIDVYSIVGRVNDMRQYYDKKSLAKLSKSIRKYGIIEPISVKKIDSLRYEVVTGQRRLMAAKMAGFIKIPCRVLEIEDEDVDIISLVDNINNEKLNFIDISSYIQDILVRYNFTLEEFSEKVGCSIEELKNKLKFLGLSPMVKKVINDNQISEEQALVITELDEQKQLKVLKDICDSKQINSQIENVNKEEITKKRVKDFRIFENTIRQAVNFMNKAGINVSYSINESDKDVQFVIKIPTTH